MQRCDFINNLSVITFYKDRHTGLFASRLTSPITTQALWLKSYTYIYILYIYTHIYILSDAHFKVILTHLLRCTTLWNVCTLPLMHNPHALTQVHTTLWNVHALSLENNPRALLRCTKLNQNLVPMAHQPICTFTFSFTIGVWIRGITFPSPLFMHCP
jgi:hypothetical protein